MIPDKKNRDAWWAFLEGAPESVWNPSRPKRGKQRGGESHGGPFTPYLGLILPPNETLATQPSPSVTPSEDDTPRKPRELLLIQLLQIDHVCLIPIFST
jgi:hypothetical protein